MNVRRPVVCLVVSAALFTGVASAHGVGGTRFDAPLPLPLLYAGAGATVGVTALWVAGTAPRVGSTADGDGVIVPPSVAAPVRALVRGLFLLALVGVLVAGLRGEQAAADNAATVFVWPVWLRGLGLFAVLFGSPWRVLSPWRTVYEGLVRLEGSDIALLGGYPDRLGEWPAVVGFVLGVGVVQTLTVIPRSPRLTAVVVAAYATAMVAGGVLFGREWFRRADALDALYRLFGRVAPVAASRTADGGWRVRLRPPWRGSATAVESLPLVAFVVATVYTVSFDGFTSTPAYRTILFATRDALGVGPVASVLLYLWGYLGFVAAFVLVAAATGRAVGGAVASWRRAAVSLAPTVLPIAAAYEVSHYYPYVVRNAGQLVTVLSRGVAATPLSVEPLAWLPLPAFWASQVALIVGGHVAAVVAVQAAVGSQDDGGPRRHAHLPLTALMVGYTALSLWIVSQPVAA